MLNWRFLAPGNLISIVAASYLMQRSTHPTIAGNQFMSNKILFWWRWLVAVNIGVMLFGISMVLLPSTTQKLFNLLMFSSVEGNPAFGQPAVAYITFVSAILGATMFGWGVALLYVLL